MPSPPKPWEVNNGTATTVVSPSAAIAATNTSTTTNDANPPIPDRSSATSMTTMNRPAAGYGTTTGYGTTGYGTTGAYGTTGTYGTAGGYGTTGYGMGGYGSSYGGYGSRYGTTGYGMGSTYGGGYGMGYGGGMYGGMGGYNRFGNRMGGMYGGMGGPEEPGLTQRMEMGTRATFEVIEQIVGAFGGFAQMLDSTFMATHSSFMAMVGVAEQLGHLKSYLGQVFSIFALYRLVKKLFNKVTGRVEPGSPMDINIGEFQQFEQKTSTPKMSRKPLFVFLMMVVGLPYLMHKLIQRISSNQQQQMLQQQQQLQLAPGLGQSEIDPSKLEFARATYDFTAESPMELSLKKGDIVAILSKVDPNTNATSQWWRGRLRDGKMGMFPANYVEIVQKASTNNSNNNNNNNNLPPPLPTNPITS